ncbi:protein-glutamate methylesterase/protein-glutamine glutaminase [Tunturiibacter gelidoferens]|uniref:Two-component system chemotaxis response regulator CheB n=1 Tax=Tunturiibacter gelidiferens TaxID=3069689 RepID=A0ACC5NU92_9BACT|nr:chemotaxis response regulator protein-glutamate methylesterase [Edaphobacter lichenicola]MBB5338110.1 two-component system chemotaxis response regulator CheB [Edaphobacter lichenicola]
MGPMEERPLRILAADDSAVMRGVMWKLFQSHAEDRSSELPRMELCGVALDGVDCLESVKRLSPDVLVLDLEMPRLNGLEVLRRLQVESPGLPVIMCSAHTERGARSTLEALACGAADYVTKPAEQRDFASAMLSLSQQLLPRIAALARGAKRKQESGVARGGSGNAREAPAGGVPSKASSPIEVVVIGLSTGGPSALEQLLPRLPADFPVPVLIVQHMPKLFTGALAERLDKCCSLRVKEAYENAMIRPGTIWLAPGDAHMEVGPGNGLTDRREGSLAGRSSRVRLHQREPLNHCRPAVDYLFFSAARMYGASTLALVMTGMGADGLDGARAVHERGGVVLAQDEASSAVWGMPAKVAEAGIASATLPLSEIADVLKQRVDVGRLTKMDIARHAASAMVPRREMNDGLL